MIDIESVVKDWETFFRNRVRGRRDLVDGYIRYVRALLSADLPPIFELHHLSALTATEQYKLAGYVMNANAFYRSFSVPKRRGGSRKIDVPVPELLRVQKWISNNILAKVPVSAAAHGFIRGRSIITNASVHVGQPMMLKMDLSSFFPSISYKRGLAVFLRMGYPANVSFFLSSLCFKDGYLPQGSAASPILSNIVAKRLDARLLGLAQKEDLRYTRYADDIVFSGASIPSKVLDIATRVVSSEGFVVNHSKTQFVGPGTKKIITGISISNGKLALPRQQIRAIKQEAHFLLKYGYFSHVEVTGKFDPILIERLLGRVAFWLQIDPKNAAAGRIFEQIGAYRESFDVEVVASLQD